MQKDENRRQNFRLLEVYHMLIQGEPLQKKQLAEQYQVSEKTIQRDIEYLRDFLTEQQNTVLRYRRRENCYILETHEKNSDETADMVVRIGRILCAAETVDETECCSMMEWLLMQVPAKKRCSVIQKIQQRQRCSDSNTET